MLINGETGARIDEGLGAFAIDDAIAVAALIAQVVGDESARKKRNQAFLVYANQAIDVTGSNYIEGCKLLNLDPVPVLLDIQFYLQQKGVTLTQEQIKADAESKSVAGAVNAATGQSLMPFIIGGAGLLAILLIMRRN